MNPLEDITAPANPPGSSLPDHARATAPWARRGPHTPLAPGSIKPPQKLARDLIGTLPAAPKPAGTLNLADLPLQILLCGVCGSQPRRGAPGTDLMVANFCRLPWRSMKLMRISRTKRRISASSMRAEESSLSRKALGSAVSMLLHWKPTETCRHQGKKKAGNGKAPLRGLKRSNKKGMQAEKN